MAAYQIGFVTVGNMTNAQKIANILIEKKLAACVSIISGVKSIYWWQDKIEKSEEVILIIKSRKNLSKDIIQIVKENHSYTVPEIIFTDISAGNYEYLDWIGANTLFDPNITRNKNTRKNL